MPPIDDAKIDLTKLAERLRTIAEELKGLRTHHPSFIEDMEVLRTEITTIVAELRSDDPRAEE